MLIMVITVIILAQKRKIIMEKRNDRYQSIKKTLTPLESKLFGLNLEKALILDVIALGQAILLHQIVYYQI